MHRHGYKGRKFGRERDERRALLKGLATELINHESIVTTTPKAKELVPYVEKLITKAKVGDLHSRRLIIAKVAHLDSAHKLVDEIAPKLTTRNSGHLRIERAGWRRGDNAQMARVSFVDSLEGSVASTATKAAEVKTPTVEKPTAKKAPATKPVAKKAATKDKK
jgi:large subunit ribosomal protein L17